MTFGDQMPSARYVGTWLYKDEKTRQPVQLPQNRRDIIASSSSSEKLSSGVLNRLNSSDKIVVHTVEQ